VFKTLMSASFEPEGGPFPGKLEGFKRRGPLVHDQLRGCRLKKHSADNGSNRGLASLVGFDEVLGERTGPSQIGNPVFALGRIGPDDITNADVAF
jgi:hypothetical protein